MFNNPGEGLSYLSDMVSPVSPAESLTCIVLHSRSTYTQVLDLVQLCSFLTAVVTDYQCLVNCRPSMWYLLFCFLKHVFCVTQDDVTCFSVSSLCWTHCRDTGTQSCALWEFSCDVFTVLRTCSVPQRQSHLNSMCLTDPQTFVRNL